MGRPEPTILGLTRGITSESEVIWRDKSLRLADSEMKLIEWMKAKPQNEAIRDVYLDFSYLLQQFTDFHHYTALIIARNESLRQAYNVQSDEIERLSKQLDELRLKVIEQ